MQGTVIASCAMSQMSMDFKGNLERILQSIVIAKDEHGAKIRVGSELETTGYSCEDHFLETDTIENSWQVIYEVLQVTKQAPYDDMLITIGAPVQNRGVRYNCMIMCQAGIIQLIKPKGDLANDTAQVQLRHFTPWHNQPGIIDYVLPPKITELTGQRTCNFGTAMLKSEDGFLMAAEICEEAWCPKPISTELFQQGADIIFNSSGTRLKTQKLNERFELFRQNTERVGGIYVYANAKGCDGQRLFFDGTPIIAMNGNIQAYGQQFQVTEVEVVVSRIDLSEIEQYRQKLGTLQGTTPAEKAGAQYATILIKGFNLVSPEISVGLTQPILPYQHGEAEERSRACAYWMWEFLRRSGASGYFLPLSGGLDSAVGLGIIGVMCNMVMDSFKLSSGYNQEVLRRDIERICGGMPDDAQAMVGCLMNTCYLATSNSTEESQNRAAAIASEIGSRHLAGSVEEMWQKVKSTFCAFADSAEPKFEAHEGTKVEDRALQNMQARSRMVMAYSLAALLPQVQGRRGFLLVMSCSDLDDNLLGNLAKYDTSAADINPMGSILKKDCRNMALWMAEAYNYSLLNEAVDIVSAMELQPLDENKVAQAEQEMGITYDELFVIAKLRKIENCGPLSMFRRLIDEWSHMDPKEIAKKVKSFFTRYSINRHKQTTMTPSLSLDTYGAEDNRLDMRQIFYETNWTVPFGEIDLLIEKIEQSKERNA